MSMGFDKKTKNSYNEQNMKVLLIIELDDQSHNNIERIERDKFVDDNLTACGYKIVHTRGAIDAIEKELQTVTKNANVPPLE